MRVQLGNQVRSKYGDEWLVTHVDPASSLVELITVEGVRFHIPAKKLRDHGYKVRWYHRIFDKIVAGPC